MPAASPVSPSVPAEAIALFLRLRRHLAIAHHIPGRIRLRIGLGALGVIGDAGSAAPTLEQLSPVFAPGTVRINAQARSVVITHDPERFPDSFWRTCLTGPEETARTMLVDALSRGPAPASEDAPLPTNPTPPV